MTSYRKLTSEEIKVLKSRMCSASDWETVEVAQDFTPEYISYARFSGTVRLGSFRKVFELSGGMKKHSGIYYATLLNVTVGDDCCIENVKNYIANYNIGRGTFIENVDIVLTDGPTAFGNGVEVASLNETGSHNVIIYDCLTAQVAYIMAMTRHSPQMLSHLKSMINSYVSTVKASVGNIGEDVVIADAGYIKNVRIGDCCQIEGASRLKNGSINSNRSAPVHIGVGVVGDDFIISSGSSVEDGVTFSRCFIGQACHLGRNYSAKDSLFFSNCWGENGEACSIFAGPYTVTHHKSTLLIAGMFSFMNAGSGSNQSNHMYKLGPVHQGVMERGAKTASDSYILWPAKIGAFSLVMGRHVTHPDTSSLPFSYLIEQQSTTYIMPGANLKSVGTVRDAKKWPERDGRTDPVRLDCVNCNLLSPYTVKKMIEAVNILNDLRKASGETSEVYTWHNAMIKRTSLEKGLLYYGYAIDKFFGNSLITRIMDTDFFSLTELRQALIPETEYGAGDWVDMAGMIAPKGAVQSVLDAIDEGGISDVRVLRRLFADLHSDYYTYEWKWAFYQMQAYYGFTFRTVTLEKLSELIVRWRSSVITLDNLIYEDARKEFELTGKQGFDSDPFVLTVRQHIAKKTALADRALKKIEVPLI